MRPLVHTYESVLELPSSYTDIICHSPPSLANQPLFKVKDDRLNCINASEHVNNKLNIKPDLEFREVLL